jgi:hypothetical protein
MQLAVNENQSTMAHKEHCDGRNGGSGENGDHADEFLVAEGAARAEKRQGRPGNDGNADEADADGAPAVDADHLAEEKRAEHHHEQRLRVTERDGLRQRQPRQCEEAEPHGRDADQPAKDLAERPGCVHRRPQFAPVGEIGDDRDDREEGAKEDDLPGRQLPRSLDAGLHADEEGD